MSGALLQLAAIGSQNQPLIGNPETTFFQFVSKRHSNFAVESISHMSEGQVAFGHKFSFSLSRTGDLISKMYFEFDLPELASEDNSNRLTWIPNVGEYLIQEVEIMIGGMVVDRHFGEWLHIWSELTVPQTQRAGYMRMIGNRKELLWPDENSYLVPGTKVTVPLQFWFCRSYGMALPIIAMEHSDIKVNVTLAPLEDLVVVWKNDGNNDKFCKIHRDEATAVIHGAQKAAMSTFLSRGNFDSNGRISGFVNNSIGTEIKAALWVDYIFLGNEERNYFATRQHNYLIEQLQANGDLSVTTQEQQFRLNFRHPVKEMVWVTKTKDYLPGHFNLESAVAKSLGEEMGWEQYQGYLLHGHSHTQGTYTNPIEAAELLINSQERFRERISDYFDSVQPYQHHTNTPARGGINVYSFALRPEETQASGAFNFSRVENPVLHLRFRFKKYKYQQTPDTDAWRTPLFSALTYDGTPEVSQPTVAIYATSYNQLRITSGMAGLVYNS
jgi:hypothetical protein